MPSSVVQSYAKQTGKSIGAVENIWAEAKKAAAKSYDKDKEPDAFWGTVNMIVRKRLHLDESNFVPNSFTSMKWAESPVEGGKEVEGDDIEDSNEVDGIKKMIKKLYTEDGFATGTGTISVAPENGGVPSGGAGQGVYADKMGTQKRKMPQTFSDWLKELVSKEGVVDDGKTEEEQ